MELEKKENIPAQLNEIVYPAHAINVCIFRHLGFRFQNYLPKFTTSHFKTLLSFSSHVTSFLWLNITLNGQIMGCALEFIYLC